MDEWCVEVLLRGASNERHTTLRWLPARVPSQLACLSGLWRRSRVGLRIPSPLRQGAPLDDDNLRLTSDLRLNALPLCDVWTGQAGLDVFSSGALRRAAPASGTSRALCLEALLCGGCDSGAAGASGAAAPLDADRRSLSGLLIPRPSWHSGVPVAAHCDNDAEGNLRMLRRW